MKGPPAMSSASTASTASTQRPTIFVAAPAFGLQFYSPTVMGLMRLYAELGGAVLFNSDAAAARARNSLAAVFLQSRCSHLLFVDADVSGFTPDNVASMIRVNLPVVCGAYPRKGPGDPQGDFILDPLDGPAARVVCDKEVFVEVKH